MKRLIVAILAIAFTTLYSCKFYTTGKPSAPYTVNVYAQDKAGNQSPVQSVTVYSESNQ